jgi:putative oxidoreductase
MLFRQASALQLNLGLLITRLVIGTIFMAHGAQKIFVFGLEGVGGGFAQMGIPLASVMGPLVGFMEFFGGMALIVGLLTRAVGVGLAGVMLGAMLIVHLPNGFFLPNGIEFVLALLGSSLLLALTGAGEYSLDQAIARRRTAATELGARRELNAKRVA